jgi:hypothetical protein
MHKATVFVPNAEGNFTINQGKQGMVTAHTNIATRVVFGTTLADNHITGNGCLAAEQFHTEAFTRAVTSVPATTACFFMGHGECSLLIKILN